MELQQVLHDESGTVSNSNLVDGLSHAKKIVGEYCTNAYKIVKENSYRVSKDALYNAFRNKISDNIAIVKLAPILEEAHTALELQGPLCNSNNIPAMEAATAKASVPQCAVGNQSEDKAEATTSPLLIVMARPEIDGDIDTGPQVLKPQDRILHKSNNEDVQVPNLSAYICTEIADPAPLLLLQRRLKSASALAASDMTEAICIHQSNLLVCEGYKQLSKSISYVKRQVKDLSPSSRLNHPMNENTILSVVEEATHNCVVSPNESEELDILLYCKLVTEDVEMECRMNRSPNDKLYEIVLDDSILVEERNVCNGHGNPLSRFNDFRQRSVPSPSNTLYTYRSDDSVQIYDNDCDNAMSVVFSSMPPKRGAKDEEIRSLLSQNVLVSRCRTYTRRRPQRLLPLGKNILSRLMCMR